MKQANIHQPLPGLMKLSTYDSRTGDLNVVIETPQGSPNKVDYDPEIGLFRLTGILPAGAAFPFDFGFAPSTLGEDRDPLDILLLMDSPTFAGCLVGARLIGSIEAEQTERDGHVDRNDRLIAVAAKSRRHRDIRELDHLATALVDEIEHFFISYNAISGKTFRPIGRSGSQRAGELVEQGQKLFREKKE